MKRKYIALAVAIIMVLVTCGTYIILYPEICDFKDKVTVNETTLYGDVSAADGLTISNESEYDSVFFWATEYKAGKKPECETLFAKNESPGGYDKKNVGMEPMIYISTSVDSHYRFNPHYNSVNFGFDVEDNFFYQLKKDAEAGTTVTETIVLSEHFEYYPLNGEVITPNSPYQIEDIPYSDEELSTLYQAGYQSRLLSNYFRIPVLSNDKVSIRMQIDFDEFNSEYSIGDPVAQNYNMNTFGDFTDDAFYFTFTTKAEDGQIVDTSLIPGGFGIYKLPFDDKTIRADLLSTEFSLDPEVQAEYLEIIQTANGDDQLILMTKEKDGHYITVIDLKTMEMVQKLRYSEEDLDPWGQQFILKENMLAIRIMAKELTVLDRADDGTLSVNFKVPLTEDFLEYSYLSKVAYDGEKLAICDRYSDMINHFNFQLTVYDENGLAYCGNYISTLDIAEDHRNYSYCVYPVSDEAFKVSW